MPRSLPPRRYVGRLSTTWDLSGSLQSYSGAPVLLGGASSSNPVADDPAVAARVAALGAPLALLGNTVVGECVVLLQWG